MTNVPNLYQGLENIPNQYAAAFIATYREAKEKATDPSYIPFTKTSLVLHGSELVRYGISKRELVLKNFPDALYTFRARADLPNEILSDGHFAIIGKGKGKYAFVRIPIPNRFRFPPAISSERISDKTPSWVNPYMGHDEQGMLTRIQTNDLIAKYLGLTSTFRLQSHLRIGVKNYGQVEVDELYVGRATNREVGIAVEAKNEAPEDCLNVSQLFGAGEALKQFFPPNMQKHLIGAKPDTSNRICLAEFALVDHPAELTQIRDWYAFEWD
ncbi:MAG: hypothetical protein NPIRA06_03480 [Nitrospirales bacterium]|nr:MAG: hypothetical protein NPIRA06_03480 [Nitrospirales bacterium]